jgi:hypothetical protein
MKKISSATALQRKGRKLIRGSIRNKFLTRVSILIAPAESLCRALVFMIVAVSAAHACVCVRLKWTEKVSLSHVIFLGEVKEYHPLEKVVFEVTEIFKGRVPRSVLIPFSNSDCDYFTPPVAPKPGERYLIYARKERKHLFVSRCLGSGGEKERSSDLVLLRNRRRKSDVSFRVVEEGAGGSAGAPAVQGVTSPAFAFPWAGVSFAPGEVPEGGQSFFEETHFALGEARRTGLRLHANCEELRLLVR